jgi:4-hydroxy-tetrahydrodipicolinate synthase
MSKHNPAGVIPAMVSPATDDGSDVDVVRARSLTRRLIESGVHGLFVCSSTGEAPLLDRTQRQRLIAAVAEENNGKLPFLVGVGAPATRQALEFVRDAEAGGADCVVALPMHFYRVTEPELEIYFATIADAASVPTLLYNYPAVTSGQNISPAMASRLAANHNIAGIKDSSGDLGQAFQYIEQCGPDFAVFTGFETLLLALVGHGGAGTICAVANVFPQILVQIYESVRAGKADLALHLQRKLVIASPLWSLGTIPAPIKAACAALGANAGPPFAPVQPISAGQYDRVSRVVRELTE